jgi:hypothetical protein
MAAGATVIFDTLADVSQTIRYNWPGSDSNGNAGYHFAAIVTNIKATASATGDVRDVQTTTPVGGFQATPFTPQNVYSTVNGSTPGPLLATELKNCYLEAVATAVS